MKKNSFNAIVAFFIISMCQLAQAQVKPSIHSLILTAEKDLQAHQRSLQVHPQIVDNNYDLKYHRFQWFVDPTKDSIAGSVTSYFIATKQDMNTIQFELSAGLIADSSWHKGVSVNMDHTGSLLTIQLANNLNAGILDSVTVFYHGKPEAGGGFGSFGTGFHNSTPALWTLSEPYGASDWWPSKNDLVDKIDSIDVYATTTIGNHVASNGILVSEKIIGDKYVLAHWKHRYPIASYLIAIASTNYARYSDYYVSQGDSLQVLNYVYPEDSLDCSQATPGTLPCIALYDSLFGKYPYSKEKYGHAEFGWGGGMEHQTMTFLGKGAFNHGIIAHELAHQWFGDMITCGSWHDIWLNESFATFCTGLTYEHLFNGIYWPIWKNQNITYACYSPAGSVYCDDTTSVNRIFDSRLSYTKGAVVLHMLRWKLGDSVFFAGIRDYLIDPALRFGFARTPDFIKHMETVSGKDLTRFFADWIYGQGYPTYTITAKQASDKSLSLTLDQTQSDPSVSFFALPVPIKFYGNGTDTTLIFDNTFSGQEFSAVLSFRVDSMKFDPDQWLVCTVKSATITGTEKPDSKSLVIRPNPANHYLLIQTDYHPESMEIRTMDGKIVFSKMFNRNETNYRIDTEKFMSGTYLLKLTSKEGIIVRKIVIDR